MRRESWILSFLLELTAFGSIFTVISGLHKYAKTYWFASLTWHWGHSSRLLAVFYGFPEPWFVQTWGGWFPYGGPLSRSGFLVEGFAFDLLCYALILAPFLLMSRWMKWDRTRAFQKIPNDYRALEFSQSSEFEPAAEQFWSPFPFMVSKIDE